MQQTFTSSIGLLLALAVNATAMAQTAPDAGRTLQQQAPRLEAPKPAKGIRIEVQPPPPVPPGGAQVAVESVRIFGTSIYTEAELLAMLGPLKGRSFDLAGLRQLSDQITEHYRRSGYPFARAYLPPQALDGGALHIEVVEGRYGQVQTQGDTPLARRALAFLAPLKSGAVIESKELERAVLLLGDQPGWQIAPVIRPGEKVGTADLVVQVDLISRLTGVIGLDNSGDRYTGQGRTYVDLKVDSSLFPGDQVTLYGLLTQQGMRFGRLGYNLPLDATGWRAQLGYYDTYYKLGKDFAGLDANGTARVSSFGLSYPLIRSQSGNLTLSGLFQHKLLNDRQGSAGTNTDKSSDTLLLSMNFDLRDGLALGGISFGSIAWTPGRLKLDSGLIAIDSQGAQTEGGFSRLNIDLATIRHVDQRVSLYARLSTQWASKNLDSSEGFGLGGPSGVRAYPVGEAYGDEGWMAQIELHFAFGELAPYVFYDAGKTRVNAEPWSPGVNSRQLSGYGVGLRHQWRQLNLEASLAWRDQGGASLQDPRDSRPRGWVAASYRL